MSRFIQFCLSSLGRKYLMALTGLLLGSFLVVHAAGNSLIFKSRAAFTAYAEHLHSLGFFLPAAELLLLTIFLLHVGTGFSLVWRNLAAKGTSYAVRSSTLGPRGWPARLMPYTGTAVLAFLLLHLATVRFVDQTLPMADRVSRVLAEPWLAVCYAAGIAALALHISHGFWSLTQSLGINHSRWNGIIRGLAWLITLLITGIFSLIILAHILNIQELFI